MKSSLRQGILSPQLPKQLHTKTIEVLDDHAEYIALTISNCDLTSQAATNLLFEQVCFRHVILNQTRLVKMRVVDSRIEACDLSGADWEKARFRRVEFGGCRLWGTKWLEAYLENVLFKDCEGEEAIFASATFKSARFEKCNLREASFQEADLTGVVFYQCDLTNADLGGTRLKGADFRGSLINGMQVGAKELQGAIIDSVQAIQVAGLLGITVKEIDESLHS